MASGDMEKTDKVQCLKITLYGFPSEEIMLYASDNANIGGLKDELESEVGSDLGIQRWNLAGDNKQVMDDSKRLTSFIPDGCIHAEDNPLSIHVHVFNE